jgi:hypothetical protein
MIKWFAHNNLVLNLDIMNIMKFVIKNSSHSTLHIGYKQKYLEETMNTKFLSLEIDDHINWKNHIEEKIREFSGACYAISFMVHISNINTTQINLLCILSFFYKIWNNFWG